MNPMNLIRRWILGRRLSPGEPIPPAPAPSNRFWPRIAATPLSDLLLGRLSASLDLRRLVADAGLPEPLAGLAYETARRGALRSNNRVGLARTTIEHFRDGLARGQTADVLAKSLLSCEQSLEPSLAVPRVALADLRYAAAHLQRQRRRRRASHAGRVG